jgi:hypothetical protein
MSKQYKNMVLCAVVSLCVSCATVAPAKVENGLYINPEYQFSVRVPTGWDMSKEIPPSLGKGMSFVSRQKFKAAFTDLKNKRFILVMAEKTEADWVSFRMYVDKFITALDKNLAEQRKKFLAKPGWKDYRYEICDDRIKACDETCVASKIDFHHQDLKATGHNIVYKSNHGMLYAISVILVAREEVYETGMTHFRSVVDSFAHL